MRLRRMLGDAGASAVEYALIIAAVAALLIPVAIGLGKVLDGVLEDSCRSTASQNSFTAAEEAAAQAECDD